MRDTIIYYPKMIYLLARHGQRRLKENGNEYPWPRLIKLIAKMQFRPRWIREGC